VYVTDLRHFEGIELDPEAPGPALRLAQHLRRVVRAATAMGGSGPRTTALSCRRRPGHRPCPGHLVVARHEGRYGIRWQCESCDDDGVIDGWQGSLDDLSVLGPRKAVGLYITVIVSEDSYRLLLDGPVLDQACERVLYAAQPRPNGVALTGSEGDLEELMGVVAFEANHARTRDRQRRWDAVYSVLDSVLPPR
jgi:hypothetical protein